MACFANLGKKNLREYWWERFSKHEEIMLHLNFECISKQDLDELLKVRNADESKYKKTSLGRYNIQFNEK